ncbi:MAG: hypothetical protein ACPGU7_08550 [Gammaproteobacteria bacterium]
MAAGVSFFNLAYLVEISVVMNLAYRELKFANIHNRMSTEIANALAWARTNEAVNPKIYPEYQVLEALENEPDSKEERDEFWAEFWAAAPIWTRWFFETYIWTKKGTYIVNANIVTSICILLLITVLNIWNPALDIVANPGAWQSVTWIGMALVLTVMTIAPLVFIRLATQVERHALGDGPKVEGKIEKLLKRIKNRAAEMQDSKTEDMDQKLEEKAAETSDGDPALCADAQSGRDRAVPEGAP